MGCEPLELVHRLDPEPGDDPLQLDLLDMLGPDGPGSGSAAQASLASRGGEIAIALGRYAENSIGGDELLAVIDQVLGLTARRASERMVNSVICGACGTLYVDAPNFCRECGTTLQKGAPPQRSAAQER